MQFPVTVREAEGVQRRIVLAHRADHLIIRALRKSRVFQKERAQIIRRGQRQLTLRQVIIGPHHVGHGIFLLFFFERSALFVHCGIHCLEGAVIHARLMVAEHQNDCLAIRFCEIISQLFEGRIRLYNQ